MSREREAALEPCPFCGAENVGTWETREGTCFVRCGCGGRTDEHGTRAVAIEAWNRRAPPREAVLEAALTLTDLRDANEARQREWDPEGKLSLLYDSNELAGETGEACNEIKKLERERLGIRGSRTTLEKLAEELADVVICADKAAAKAGIDLAAAVIAKFNSTSEKNGLATRLSARAALSSAVEEKPTLKDKPAHMSQALEWIERNHARGIELVARAFAETYAPAPPAQARCAHDVVRHQALEGVCIVERCARCGRETSRRRADDDEDVCGDCGSTAHEYVRQDGSWFVRCLGEGCRVMEPCAPPPGGEERGP